MSETKPKYKRKISNLIINPKFQLRYILWLSTSGLSLITLNGFIIYHYLKENYFTLVEMSPMTDEAKVQLYSELHQFIWILVGASILFLILVGLLGVFFSHRTAGPLFHFKRVFEGIRDGNRTMRVRLRPKDEFRDVAESFNQMMDSLQNK